MAEVNLNKGSMARGLEIRINTVNDGRSVVQNMIAIQQQAEQLQCTHIELVVAEEVHQAVKPLIGGLLRFKSIIRVTKTRPDNILYDLPPFVNIVRLPKFTQEPKKRVGWPKGKPRKPVAQVAA